MYTTQTGVVVEMLVGRMLGMVVPDNSNPYFAELARSIEDACFERDYSVILCNSDEEPAKERAYLSLLAEERVDGIVFVTSGDDRSGVQADKLATELVLARLHGDRKEPQTHRLKTSLVVRGSCGIEPLAESRADLKQTKKR